MEEGVGEAGVEDSRRLGTELLQQGERCTLAGFPQQAEAILTQAWEFANKDFPKLGDTAAWDLALLRLRDHDYAGAAEWFARIIASPSIHSQVWPEQRHVLIQTCHALRSALAKSTETPAALVAPAQRSVRTSGVIPRLVITNLGRFHIVRGGELLPVCRARKAIALFRYLLSRNHQTANREELMDVLWPDARPQEAAHSLHVAVSTLRRYLDLRAGSYLMYTAGQYTLNPNAPLEADSLAFAQLGDEADHYWRKGNLPQAQRAYAQTIAYYQGDYYVDDHDLAWALAERERLLARYLVALDRLGQIWMEQKHFDAAAECYQRLLERDGYREDAHYQLMRSYLYLDRRGDALRQYERCSSILASDLGLEPMPELQELYQRVIGAE